MRLIDADRLLQGYEDHDFIDTHVVWNAPTVDAVPVIRCKDCEHHGTRTNMCDIWHRHTNGEGYCHRAKAKSKEQKSKSKGGEEE